MPGPAARLAVAALLAVSIGLSAQSQESDLAVHEWGTFTTIAGQDGQAMQWLPLGGPTDLPCFVEYYRNRLYKVMPPPELGAVLDYEKARAGLKGTVRMETPVLYFYSQRPTTVGVQVTFPQGLFTEFYPYADVRQVPSYSNILSSLDGRPASNGWTSFPAKITWTNVEVTPGVTPALERGPERSHYYAARETDAAPIRVGNQNEKFLFYRGVGGFGVPLSATLQPDGRILVRNQGSLAMPAVIVLTSHGGKMGYRVYGALAGQREVALDAPILNKELSALRADLERILTEQGLYAREAKAMVETWRDDWFNDGTRIFYIVPQPEIDAMLPLSVYPKPSSVVRVFVGRMEVITPASIADVERALAANDEKRLDAYGRWLGPIGDCILAKMASADERTSLLGQLDRIFKSYLARVTACQ
jgi:hypothetical protein